MDNKRFFMMGDRRHCIEVARILGLRKDQFKIIHNPEMIMGCRDFTMILCHGWSGKGSFHYHNAMRINYYCRNHEIPVLEVDY